jgi:hypothetical protein
MPDLAHTLQGNDLGFLKMVASAWGIELNSPDAYTALPVLVSAMQNRRLASEVIETLPAAPRNALKALIENDGALPWSLFCRKFGEVRVMGAAKRDRERPDLNPESPAEQLWYRALIGKAFFNHPPEPQEFAYIPEDLLEYLQALGASGPQPLGRPASPAEIVNVLPASDRLLDHACTLLAALRLNPRPDELAIQGRDAWEAPVPSLRSLLLSAGLLDANNAPLPENTRAFLEASRPAALSQLCRSWLSSPSFNDLHNLPGLVFEGEWNNHPLEARQSLLELLSTLPQDKWWNLSSFIAAVRERKPDFQRPAGDYDSWFIRKEGREDFLRGFSAWDEVDGALIRFIITGPMHWLGMMDLAGQSPDDPPAAFRPSAWAAALYNNQPPKGLPAENAPVRVTAAGHLRLTNLTPRSARYLIARFCEWEGEQANEYNYFLTPASLERARQQGLRISHLVSLLKKHAAGQLPPSLLQALERWEQFGVQAGIKKVSLLRVASPDILDALRKTRAARYLGEALNPTTVLVKPGGEEALRSALAELGYLASALLDV